MVIEAILMMLGVTTCYTISSLSDKYALLMLFFIKPSEILKKNKEGALKVVLARIPTQ